MKAVFAEAGPEKEDNMQTKEAINILNHAVEYYDMMYSSGDSKHDEGEKNKAWKALDHVASELKASSTKLDKLQAPGYNRSRKKRII